MAIIFKTYAMVTHKYYLHKSGIMKSAQKRIRNVIEFLRNHIQSISLYFSRQNWINDVLSLESSIFWNKNRQEPCSMLHLDIVFASTDQICEHYHRMLWYHQIPLHQMNNLKNIYLRNKDQAASQHLSSNSEREH